MANNVSSLPIRRKAGVIPYRCTLIKGVEILLVTARTQPDSWIFPMGAIDPGETALEAAARECMEESGYVVVIEHEIDNLKLPKAHSIHQFAFFTGLVTGEVQNYERDRQRRWVSVSVLAGKVPAIFKPIAQAAQKILK